MRTLVLWVNSRENKNMETENRVRKTHKKDTIVKNHLTHLITNKWNSGLNRLLSICLQ